ncbi:hypothetical protein AHF37_04448 [Paragonimus kellicotti]|nr:hypothetical protein AHF37_04448 [Paragonimus kellicotti]
MLRICEVLTLFCGVLLVCQAVIAPIGIEPHFWEREIYDRPPIHKRWTDFRKRAWTDFKRSADVYPGPGPWADF